MIDCSICSHQNAVVIAGESREHLTPCWTCGEYHRNFENKYCSSCKYRNMNGVDDNPPCSDCGDDYRRWEEDCNVPE